MLDYLDFDCSANNLCSQSFTRLQKQKEVEDDENEEDDKDEYQVIKVLL